MKPDALLIAFALIFYFLLMMILFTEGDRENSVCIDGMLMESRGGYYVSLNKECVMKSENER